MFKLHRCSMRYRDFQDNLAAAEMHRMFKMYLILNLVSNSMLLL